MGMPVTVEIASLASDSRRHSPTDAKISEAIGSVFAYFEKIDKKFSTYKKTSEISAINEGRIGEDDRSEEMSLIFALAAETKKETFGYFDIRKPDGTYDPSGIVKGWAIWNAAQLLKKNGLENFYIDAGGDIQTSGKNKAGKNWAIGIKNPWNESENVKVIYANTEGVATSGTYIRGNHIYDPKTGKAADEIVSLTVIGPNIYEADRFATAAFAMGKKGIEFIEKLAGFEAYMIDANKIATMTSEFERHTKLPPEL